MRACDVGVVDCGFISEFPGLDGADGLGLLLVSLLKLTETYCKYLNMKKI